MGRQAELYNGTEYINLDRFIVGHQFFQTMDWEKGDIFFDGLLYRGIELRYDLVQDEVIIPHFSQSGYAYSIMLNKENISYFKLLDHDFIHIRPDSARQLGLKPGFYDVLFDDQVQVLARRIKSIAENSYAKNNKEFYLKKRYFIKNKGRIFPVRSKRTLLKALEDRKKEIKRYMRRNHYFYRTDPEFTMLMAAKYYLELNNL